MIEEGPLLICEGGSAGEHTGEVGRQEGGWPYEKANIEPDVNIVVADESTQSNGDLHRHKTK